MFEYKLTVFLIWVCSFGSVTRASKTISRSSVNQLACYSPTLCLCLHASIQSCRWAFGKALTVWLLVSVYCNIEIKPVNMKCFFVNFFSRSLPVSKNVCLRHKHHYCSSAWLASMSHGRNKRKYCRKEKFKKLNLLFSKILYKLYQYWFHTV